MTRRFRLDEGGAAASMVAFMIAGVLFMGSIAAVLLTTQNGASGAAASTVPQAELHVGAASLSQLLVFSPGHTTGGLDWADEANEFDGTTGQADAVSRLGLKNATSPDPLMMSFEKFHNLRLAPYAEDEFDGFVNYPEARKAFGLDAAGLDFHIRAYPTLPGVAELLKGGYKDKNLRIAYIGDASLPKNEDAGGEEIDPGAGLVLSAVTCTVDAATNPKAYRIGATITNGGTAATQFEAIIEVTFSNSDVEYHKVNTFLVAPGAQVEVYAHAAALSGRSCSGKVVDVRVYDAENLLKTSTTTLAEPASTPATAPRAIMLKTSSENYRPGEVVTVSYSGKSLAKDNKLVLTACPGASECRLGADSAGHRVNITVPNQEKNWNYAFPADTFATAGDYTLRLYDNTADPDAEIETDSMRAWNRLLVTDAEPGPYVPPNAEAPADPGAYVASEAAVIEVGYLNRLVDKFCPTWFDSQTGSAITEWGAWAERCGFKESGEPDGDVYPGIKKVLKDHLAPRLMVGNSCSGDPNYDLTDVLVIGSNVDHNVMTSGDVKGCIEAWVLGGGTLIVYGSMDMNTQWLEAIFHTKLESSSGGLSVPDAGHPVLHVADALDYSSYDSDRAWELKTTGDFDAEEAFTRVANDDNDDAILAVSDPGAFGKGTVILTGWTPYDLRGNGAGTDGVEGMKFANNLLMIAYRDLYLDYGPPLPPNANVEPAVAKVHIKHPQFEDPILLDVSVYVFKG